MVLYVYIYIYTQYQSKAFGHLQKILFSIYFLFFILFLILKILLLKKHIKHHNGFIYYTKYKTYNIMPTDMKKGVTFRTHHKMLSHFSK